ncbi:MAG: DUF4440 domain-containing protein [Acidobacteria bacterium]|nr:DUF4440 domain-containing protein [Acidobacteriota bacterium]MBV9145538.1 DUF4440 domain-containing protein [Acidobacteriota bacterium]MBV9437997.1 DUF4440 domain-containing protein [Acidobacteriota bacterium]
MPKLLLHFLSILLLSFSMGVAQTLPSPSTEMPVDSQAGSVSPKSNSDLSSFNRRFIDACRAKDNAAALALWADDGVDLLPGMDPMVGKPAITAWLNDLEQKTKDARILQCDVDWKETKVAGDMAYEWGINTQTVSLPNRSEPLKIKGKITLILRKQQDGSWKLVLESWNSNPQPE